MPAEFLSAEHRVAYASFVEVPSLSDLEKFFFLDGFDRNVIAQSRADSHRLGVAVQIGTVRYKGLFLEDPLAVPWPVVDYLAEQLGIGDASQVKKYAERPKPAASWSTSSTWSTSRAPTSMWQRYGPRWPRSPAPARNRSALCWTWWRN